MPVVVKAVARKRLQGRGAGPQVVIHAGGNWFFGGVPDGWAPLVANRAGHVDVADCAVTQMPNGFQHAGVRTRLAAVLANSVVLLDGAHQLPSFKRVMRARLFHIDVFRRLAGPDGHERVPMIRRSDGDGVDIFVLEQLADIDVGFGLWQSQLIDVPEATVQHGLIDITERSNFCFCFAGTATTEIYTLSLHAALPPGGGRRSR